MPVCFVRQLVIFGPNVLIHCRLILIQKRTLLVLKRFAITTSILPIILFVKSQPGVALTPPMGWNSRMIIRCMAVLACSGVTGSYNFEEQDAKSFSKWGIDFLKYGICAKI
ncbi:hypothetical protein A4D02_06915 [Niastella koreensis]|uniref:Alpha-galactosidase n=2 Tax=Niastella koreensis TaxID=354356 RepID=G8THC0_NIAKG|nr:hypothetical protein Niako_5495 [Niastella koreensis GR20-10]OQP48438.1 hypothetical protein A4D02_06915 [Niastella koreensis]